MNSEQPDVEPCTMPAMELYTKSVTTPDVEQCTDSDIEVYKPEEGQCTA